MKKKGQVQTLAPAILGLVFAAIVLVFGLVMIQETRDTDVVTSATGCNATSKAGCLAYASANDTLAGMGTFADFWEIIVLAIVITVVIGLLLVVFGGRRSR